jgi:hypothetical protein
MSAQKLLSSLARAVSRGGSAVSSLYPGVKNSRSPAPLLDFRDGKRHRGGARDDSNPVVDFIELTNVFILSAAFWREGPCG